MNNIFVFAAVVVLSILGAAEAVSRLYLGLGHPPLSVAHPTIEYMFAPDQDVSRFGNRQVYNAYGMRNDPQQAWGMGHARNRGG
jgi:hypothetical protein